MTSCDVTTLYFLLPLSSVSKSAATCISVCHPMFIIFICLCTHVNNIVFHFRFGHPRVYAHALRSGLPVQRSCISAYARHASAMDSLDARSREKVEEARARARPGNSQVLHPYRTRSMFLSACCRAQRRRGLDKAGIRRLLPPRL